MVNYDKPQIVAVSPARLGCQRETRISGGGHIQSKQKYLCSSRRGKLLSRLPTLITAAVYHLQQQIPIRLLMRRCCNLVPVFPGVNSVRTMGVARMSMTGLVR